MKSLTGNGVNLNLLVFNLGSSSIKFSIYDLKTLEKRDPSNPILERSISLSEDANIKQTIIACAKEELEKHAPFCAIGYRVVHGGPDLLSTSLITNKVKEEIKNAIPLAPLHNPTTLVAIETFEQLFPNIKAFAIFDTAFFINLPESAKVYPIPFKWYEKGIRKYGFHGINHHYCMKRATVKFAYDPQNIKMITCHLGAGCSLSAIENQQCINTTMGFTPLDGIMMATRSGCIDPGIIIYLMKHYNLSIEELDSMLNHESGLKGISASSNMKEIIERAKKNDKRSILAFKMFIHHLRSSIGSFIAELGGLDVLIFTGGIGENSPDVRKETLRSFDYMGWKLDEEKNVQVTKDTLISNENSSTDIAVIHANEDWMIAKECYKQLYPFSSQS